MSRFRTISALCISVVLAGGSAYAQNAANADRAKARAAKAEARADQRQANQAKRIEQGIKKGYLTADEAAKLQAEEKSIAELEASFKADGKVTRDEAKQLRNKLNEASAHIWAEKHDTNGNQMPTYRLGKNVFAKSNITTALEGDISGAEARAILKDFHQAVRLKHRLATADLTPEKRAELQAKYNDLLNKYFEVRTTTTTASGK